MRKTFFVGDDKKNKIDVDFRFTGKERIYVDNALVHDDRDFSMKGSRQFKAGMHDVRIDLEGSLKDWSCKVYVDGSLFIEELFAEELKRHKNRRLYLHTYYKFLIIIVIGWLLFNFLRGFFQGMTGTL